MNFFGDALRYTVNHNEKKIKATADIQSMAYYSNDLHTCSLSYSFFNTKPSYYLKTLLQII